MEIIYSMPWLINVSLKIVQMLIRSSHQRCSVRKDVLRNSAKFTGNHLSQSLFIKKETLAQVFSREFWEISKNTFFTEHLWVTASGLCDWWEKEFLFFPEDQELRRQCICFVSNRDWTPTKYSVVCFDRFREKFIKREKSDAN